MFNTIEKSKDLNECISYEQEIEQDECNTKKNSSEQNIKSFEKCIFLKRKTRK